MNQDERNAQRCLDIIDRIERLIMTLDNFDPYGDLAQNFCDDTRDPVTKRLKKLIKDDLEQGYWKKARL